MAGSRIPNLDPLSGAASANDDKFVVFDTSENETKRMDRSQVATGLVGDLPYTPSGGISATTIPTAIAELDSEAAKSAALAASSGSSLIGHISSGTGATARTVQSKLREVVSVKDFGAVGDGAANDTAAIQAALNSAATDIVLEQGKTYLCNSTLSFPSGKRLSGRAKLKLGTAGQRLIRTVSNAQNCVFEDFELEGFSGPGGGYIGGEFGIQLDEADWCVIRNVTAYNFGGDGFYVGPNTANNNLIENCIGYNNGRQGVTLAGGTFNVVRGGYYYDNTLYGVDCEGPTVSDSLIEGVTAWGNFNGITSESGTLGKAIISNCRCYSNDEHGIQSFGVNDQVVGNICYSNGRNGIFGAGNYQIISDNECFSNTWSGIQCDPGVARLGATITGNVCKSNARNGIAVSRVASSVIDGNIAVDNDVNDTTTWAGISVGGAVGAEGSNNTISNNVIGNTAPGVRQRFGLSIGANCNSNAVAGNSFKDNKQAAVLDSGTSNTFTKNKGYLNENGGTSAAISTGGTITHGLIGTPTIFNATPTGVATDVVVTANSTNLTVTFGGGGSVAFAWRAAMQNSM
jgi:parallel beta-helix repeat protein